MLIECRKSPELEHKYPYRFKNLPCRRPTLQKQSCNDCNPITILCVFKLCRMYQYASMVFDIVHVVRMQVFRFRWLSNVPFLKHLVLFW